MKQVKIFLASSVELDEDKREFDNYFAEKNKIYRERYIDFDQRTWKDFVSSVSAQRLQDRYNEYIQTCDIAIFLFHTKIGQYTKEEFEVAHKAFLKNKKGKPRIYIFLKEENNVTDPELLHFKQFNEKELGHFCDTYTDYKDLLMKFDKQLQLLENEKFIQPNPIDTRKIIKYAVFYFLLPLLVLGAVLTAVNYYSATNMTVRIIEDKTYQIPGLPFTEGEMQISYADVSPQTFDINNTYREANVKEIHSKYKGEPARIIFTANGYEKIDTIINIGKIIELPIRRNNNLGIIFGSVIDEKGAPIEDVTITVQDLQVKTDETGNFKLTIPFSKQQEEQRLSAFKKGYQRWDFTAPVSADVPWHIVLKK